MDDFLIPLAIFLEMILMVLVIFEWVNILGGAISLVMTNLLAISKGVNIWVHMMFLDICSMGSVSVLGIILVICEPLNLVVLGVLNLLPKAIGQVIHSSVNLGLGAAFPLQDLIMILDF
jgi:hypothetical protein